MSSLACSRASRIGMMGRAKILRATLLLSGRSLGDEASSGAQGIGLCTKRRQRGVGLRNQFLEARSRSVGSKRAHQCRLAGSGILAGGFTERLGVALDIEQIVGNLEGLANRHAIAINTVERCSVSLSENRPGAAGKADQRPGFHRLQGCDFLFAQHALLLEAAFG